MRLGIYRRYRRIIASKGSKKLVMNDRKDDIIIGLLVVIIVLQVYGLFLGNTGVQVSGQDDWQNFGDQEVTTLPSEENPSNEADIKALGDAVKEVAPADDPNSGANVPGKPGEKQPGGEKQPSGNAQAGDNAQPSGNAQAGGEEQIEVFKTDAGKS